MYGSVPELHLEWRILTLYSLCQFRQHMCLCVLYMCVGVCVWNLLYSGNWKKKKKKLCMYIWVCDSVTTWSQVRFSVKVRAFFPTWDMFGPADVDHQLSVRQVTQRSQGLDVAVWYSWVRHGVNLLWLGHQQVRDDFVICKAAKGNWHDHQTRRKTQRQRDGEFLLH